MVKNPSANAGDMGSISGPARSHPPQSNQACSVQPRADPAHHSKEKAEDSNEDPGRPNNK